MNVTLRLPRMTREQFLDWAERQTEPYEFDGLEPVAMTGGTRRHALICSNLLFAIRSRLSGKPYDVLLEAGLATDRAAVRYPDVVILPANGDLQERLMSGVIAAFEVESPSSGRLDRTIKPAEYRLVPTMRRYVIVDDKGPHLDVFARNDAGEDWTVRGLALADVLQLPEIGIEIPVGELFAGVEDQRVGVGGEVV